MSSPTRPHRAARLRTSMGIYGRPPIAIAVGGDNRRILSYLPLKAKSAHRPDMAIELLPPRARGILLHGASMTCVSGSVHRSTHETRQPGFSSRARASFPHAQASVASSCASCSVSRKGVGSILLGDLDFGFFEGRLVQRCRGRSGRWRHTNSSLGSHPTRSFSQTD